jgi:hypothetical protein
MRFIILFFYLIIFVTSAGQTPQRIANAFVRSLATNKYELLAPYIATMPLLKRKLEEDGKVSQAELNKKNEFVQNQIKKIMEPLYNRSKKTKHKCRQN